MRSKWLLALDKIIECLPSFEQALYLRRNLLESEPGSEHEFMVSRQARYPWISAVVQLWLQVRFSQMPLPDLEEKTVLFLNSIEAATQETDVIRRSILAGKSRVIEHLEKRMEPFGHNVGSRVHETLRETLAGLKNTGEIGALAQATLSKAIPYFFEKELREVLAEIIRHINVILIPHGKESEELAASFRQSISRIFDISGITSIPIPSPLAPEKIQATHRPWKVSLKGFHGDEAEKFLASEMRLSRVFGRLADEVNVLIIQNLAHARQMLLDLVEKVFDEFRLDLKASLKDPMSLWIDQIAASLEKRRKGEKATQSEIESLLRKAQCMAGVQRKILIMPASSASDAGCAKTD